MNYLNAARGRHIAVLRAIIAGAVTVPDVHKHVRSYSAEEIRTSLGMLRQRGIIRSTRKAQSGRPALYELLMTEDEAMEIIAPRGDAKVLEPSRLEAVWPSPVHLPQGRARLVVLGGD